DECGDGQTVELFGGEPAESLTLVQFEAARITVPARCEEGEELTRTVQVRGSVQLVEVCEEEPGIFPHFTHDGLPGCLTGVTPSTEHRPVSGPDDPGNVVT